MRVPGKVVTQAACLSVLPDVGRSSSEIALIRAAGGCAFR